MPLESATYISDLNASNPVGSTDKVQTLDDHVRLIKSAVKATFPNVTGEVTPTHTELNYVDGVTSAIQTQLNSKLATNGTGSDLTNVPKLNASNTFTNALQRVTAADPGLRLRNSSGGSNAKVGDFISTSDALKIRAINDAEDTITREVLSYAFATDALALTAVGGITLNGVAASGFARLSQSNTFSAATQLISNSSNPSWSINDGTIASAYQSFPGAGAIVFGTTTAHQVNLVTSNVNRVEISAGGAIALLGAVTAAVVANSDSETLVAGQLHFIDGNATLPNLTAGQWVQVINDSGSPITISKNGSDTTYWSTTGATVSTSFTLAARGVLTARCNPAGAAVYVSGSGITAAS